MSRTIKNKSPLKKNKRGWHISGMGHGKTNIGKYKVGYGGINCPCCTILPPDELKIKTRRYIRRKDKCTISEIIKEIDNG